MTRQQFRFASFEGLEPRLVMSSQALTDFVGGLQAPVPGDQIDHQIELITQAESVDSNPQTVEPFSQSHGLDGSGQTVVIIDSGIAYDHAALGGSFGSGHKVVGGYDFAENDANPYDDGPVGLHGTHIAGIIGAESEDFVGIAPGADLVALRVFDDSGNGELAWVEQALRWVHENRNAFENPITTVNLSLGTQWNANTLPDPAQLEDEFSQLEADGIFISVAAGNLFQDYYTSGVSYPAASPFVVPVASHAADGDLSDFSQRNDRVLVAPGENVLSTVPEHVFGGTREDPLLRASGTSQSAPFVAGASVLLRQAFEESGHTEIDQDFLYEHFRETADVIFDQATGGHYHRINLERALQTALSQNSNTGEGSQNPGNVPFYVQNGTLYINGTAGDDEIRFTQGHVLEVVVNNTTFNVHAHSVSHVLVTGGGGTDSITTEFSSQVDRAMLNSNRIDVHAPTLDLTARGFENIHYQGANTDRLIYHDSAGNDQVVAGYGQFIVNGNGYSHQATGFTRLQASSTSGYDTIELEGSNGEDRFVSRDGRNVIKNASNRIVAKGFEKTTIVATAGQDLARLYDSAGNDQFELSAGEFRMESVGLEVLGSGFARINAYSENGFDTVVMTGTDAADHLLHRDGRTRIQGQGYSITSTGFDLITAWGKGGVDIGQIHGSSGSDQFTAEPFNTHLRSSDASLYTSNFDIIDVFADLAGTDTANLSGTGFSDLVSATVNTAKLQNALGQSVTVHDFDQVTIDTEGGFDNTSIVGGTGIDLLRSLDDGIEYHSMRQMLRIVEAENHVFDGREGYDEVLLDDFDNLDLLAALGDQATASYRDRTVTAIDFEFLEASTRVGATGVYDIDAADFLFLLDGDWQNQDAT